MNVYVASAFLVKEKAEMRAQRLRDLGLTVVSTWHEPGQDDQDIPECTQEKLQRIAQNDMAEIRQADMLLLCNDLGGESRGGKDFEAGHALAHGKIVVVVGATGNALLYDPHVLRYPSWALAEPSVQALMGERVTEHNQAPSIDDLATLAAASVRRSMAPTDGSATGSLKSGPGEWFTKDPEGDPAYHVNRSIRHLITAANIQAGTESDGEGVERHAEKAVCRAAMALACWRQR